MKYSLQYAKFMRDQAEQLALDAANAAPDVFVGDDYSLAFCKTGRVYKPFPTLARIHADKDADVKIVIGGYGTGKSTALMIAEIILYACAMPKCRDGIRRCRWIVIRNTNKNLRDTAIDLWRTWCDTFGRAKERKSVPLSWEHDFRDQLGRVHLEIWFTAINDEQQLRDFKSLQASCYQLGELSELAETALHTTLARGGRYPAQFLLGEAEYKPVILADTNPPEEGTWLPENWEKDATEISGNAADDYQIFEKTIEYETITEDGGKAAKKIISRIYHQPPALLEDGLEAGGRIHWRANPKAENIKNLAGGYGYYFKMIPNGDEFIKVYACGRYGSLKAGVLVHPEFNRLIHVQQTIAVDPSAPILIGIDHGWECPAFVICQYVEPQLRVIKEFAGRTIYVDELFKSAVEPWLNQNARGIVYNAWDDPANTMHGRERLREIGLQTNPAMSNKLEDRLPVVSRLLSELRGGKPAIAISADGCPNLIRGFESRYVFEMVNVIGAEIPKRQPDKTHPYSDLQDALQYVAQQVILNPVALNPKVDTSQFINNAKW